MHNHEIQKIIDENFNNQKVVGIGSGSTMSQFLKQICNSDTSKTTFIPSSYKTLLELEALDLTTSHINTHRGIDIYFDSTDLFDRYGNLLKGGGCALTQEKLLANMVCANGGKMHIIAQKSKYVESFKGSTIAVEILPASYGYFSSFVNNNGLKQDLRGAKSKCGPIKTDLGNFIVDVEYNQEFVGNIKGITGVIEHGFFDAADYNIEMHIINDF